MAPIHIQFAIFSRFQLFNKQFNSLFSVDLILFDYWMITISHFKECCGPFAFAACLINAYHDIFLFCFSNRMFFASIFISPDYCVLVACAEYNLLYQLYREYTDWNNIVAIGNNFWTILTYRQFRTTTHIDCNGKAILYI